MRVYAYVRGGAPVRPSVEPRSIDALRARLDERFRGPLMSFFLRRVRDPAEAEDLTQEVFAKLLAAAARGEIEDADALVFVTAGNLLKDRGRKAARRAQSSAGAIDPALVRELT